MPRSLATPLPSLLVVTAELDQLVNYAPCYLTVDFLLVGAVVDHFIEKQVQ